MLWEQSRAEIENIEMSILLLVLILTIWEWGALGLALETQRHDPLTPEQTIMHLVFLVF